MFLVVNENVDDVLYVKKKGLIFIKGNAILNDLGLCISDKVDFYS